MNNDKLRKYLDKNYLDYKKYHSSNDPVWFLHNLKDENEIEVTAFILSCFAYGKVEVMNEFFLNLSSRIAGNLYEFVLNFEELKDKKYLDKLYYRFNVSEDLVFLFSKLKQVITEFGTLEKLFLSGYSNNDANILKGLYGLTDFMKKGIRSDSRYHYLIPDTRKNSTCKRLNLFLRWMVRKDEIDLGIWNKDISKSKLLIPVDTHIYKISQRLKLVIRKSCDLKYAIELTEKLKQFDPEDPVKYDFALCHIGIDKKKSLRFPEGI
ncbi:MAG TPA: TIGR02757 family protein [Ignavibacteria bacterium]